MIRVGILRGGIGEDYQDSLQKGGEVFSYIMDNLSDKYKPLDVLVDKNGNWHLSGRPILPGDLLHKVDIVWNTAHPNTSQVLKNFSLPIVNENIFSHLVKDKSFLEQHLKELNVNFARHLLLSPYQIEFDGPVDRYVVKKAMEVFKKFGAPWTVKVFTNDANTGILVAKTFPELVSCIRELIDTKKSILIEELIVGKEVSLHALNNFRKQDVYTFPVFNLSNTEKNDLNNLILKLHNHFDKPKYIKIDVLLNNKGNVYLYNVDFHPDFSSNSILKEICESIGENTNNVLENMIISAMKDK